MHCKVYLHFHFSLKWYIHLLFSCEYTPGLCQFCANTMWGDLFSQQKDCVRSQVYFYTCSVIHNLVAYWSNLDWEHDEKAITCIIFSSCNVINLLLSSMVKQKDESYQNLTFSSFCCNGGNCYPEITNEKIISAFKLFFIILIIWTICIGVLTQLVWQYFLNIHQCAEESFPWFLFLMF